MTGRRSIYLCADDTHGTAIMIRARQEGRSEVDVIADMSAAHQKDFADFQIKFDHYGSTHSNANREICNGIWAALRDKGLVVESEETQLFDPKEGVFLADRFVKGTCPNCKSPDQYGDSCDKCGTTYEATALLDARSTLSGAIPEIRSATHLLVRIEPARAFLSGWTQAGDHLQPEIANFLTGQFLSKELHDWDVSRPAPYFGFEIPDAPGHYWYVWFDAPIGYIAATKEWCDDNGKAFESYWKSSDTEIVHVIGKDIVRFHTLFWPAVLHSSGYSLPSRVHVHGFLTVNGEKMSKRKGTFVLARTYLDHLDPAYLRYFFASKLSSGVDDIDLDVAEMVQKVNSDLVNKVVNLASRTARFVEKTGLSAAYPEDEGLFEKAAEDLESVCDAYECFDTAKVTRVAVAAADRANEYVNRMEPWVLAKQKGQEQELQNVCTVALNLFRQIVLFLAPILPKLADDTRDLLGAPMDRLDLARRPVVGTPVAPYKHMMKRMEEKSMQAVIAASAEQPPIAEPTASPPSPATSPAGAPAGAPAIFDDGGEPLANEPLAAECTIDDFGKIDLRVARIVSAEAVPEAKKLLKLTVSLGGEHRRTVFAGIKAYYKPEELVGRLVVICANLAPRKMKLGTSEGMILAAGDDATAFVLSPDSGAKPGMRVH
jgi:methionyl-tRNA synthetase